MSTAQIATRSPLPERSIDDPPRPAPVPAGAPPRVLAEWFDRGLRIDPTAEALRVDGHTYSYRWLHERALALAGDLVSTAGAAPRRVGLLASRTPQAYAGLLAAVYSGAAVVPLHPDFPAERTRQMMAAARVDTLIVDEHGERVLPELAAELTDVVVVREPGGTPLAAPRQVGADEIAYILFTSGSTGRPKGVPVLHRNVDAYLRFVHDRYGFTAADVFSQTFDLTFDLAMFDLFAGWGSGGTVVTVPPTCYANLAEFLTEHRITVWFSSPSVIALTRRLRRLAPDAFPSLRWSLFCGEPLLAHDAADWQAAAPGSLVENLYGPTELTISCSVHRWDPDSSPARCVNDVVSIGTMHPGMRHLIRPVAREAADDAGIELPGAAAGTVGELCVTGDQMFPGYLDPADDEGRFLRHGGERWYRTGDLVRPIGGGELAYLGRVDHQVKIRGVRVELAEIECRLRALDGVQDAVAVVVDDVLVAFCVGVRRPAAVLAGELAATLPRALLPRRFVFLAEFPLNANRKTDRRALAATAAELVGS
ncbi:AMP-binding protein [Micromonospora sp. AMSO12t]|uniref:AMP-binding protein n=1 Tax=Micromonospora sp. AMSO12t TaxID=2650410 RepID=UPI001CED38F6|nr:AMP-binding protein [Micromonospora sp. AMSO12t]